MVSQSPSQTDYSEFDTLPDAEPVVTLPPETPHSDDRTPDEKICPVCDKPIYRDPSWKRMRKYHPDCRPTGTSAVTDLFGGNSRASKTRDAKKAAEADECIVWVKRKLVQAAMALAMIDSYDGFCVMSGIPAAMDNLRGVLIAHDSFRKDMLRVNDGGSIVGLVISVVMMVVPIAAHHGLVPSTKIAEMLVNLPIVMHKISKRMKEGEQALTDMMDKAAEGMLKAPGQAKAEQNGASPSNANT